MMTAEEKAKFRSHFLELGQGRIIPPTNTFWNTLWTYPTCAEDVYESLTPSDIRTVRNQNKVNFILLIRILCTKIVEYGDPVHIDKLSGTKHTVELLNCIRFVSKLVPFVFELAAYHNDLETVFFWSKEFDPIEYSRREAPVPLQPHEIHESLAVRLLSSLIKLLFVNGFTTSSKSMTVWEPGIGQRTKYDPPNLIIDSNRSELLKLLITLCSSPMYSSILHLSSTGSKFLTYLVSSTPKQELLFLVCSLVNVACRASRSSMDESSLIYPENIEYSEIRHVVVAYSFQLLTLLVAYPLPSPTETKFLVDAGLITSKPHNMARLYMGRIYKDNEILFLATSLVNILRFPVTGTRVTENGTKVKSTPPALWATEAAMLIWELMQCNKNFKELIGRKFVSELMVVLMYYTFSFHSNHVHANLVRVCTYLMLYLSSEDMINDLFFPMSSSLYESLPGPYKLQYHPLTTRDFLVCQICNCIIGKQANLLYLTNKPMPDLLAKTLVEILYNLIQPVSNDELNVHNDPLKKLNNPNSRGGLSYAAACSITHLIVKLSNRSFVLEIPFHSTSLALVIRAVATAAMNYPGPSRMLLFSMIKNEKVFQEVRNTMASLHGVHFKQGVPVRIDNTPEVVPVTPHLINGSFRPSIYGEPIETYGIARPINREEDHYMTEDETVAESLRPSSPRGMTNKAREKMKKNIPIGKSWGGDAALKTILEVIIPKLHEVLDESEENEILKMVQLIEDITFEDNYEKPEPLRFTWSHLSLGWYMSLLFHEIYDSNDLMKSFMRSNNGIFKSIGSSLASVSMFSYSWNSLLSRKPKTNQDEIQWVKNSLTNYNHWANTNVRLFKIDSGEGFFSSINKIGSGVSQSLPVSPVTEMATQFGKRFSELRLNSNQNRSSPVLSISAGETPPQRPDTLRKLSRNSISSLHTLNAINRTRSNTIV
ncbi:uncharacterized protein SPAPADRAFT_130767 [Spathaspora passalidarum NRRL Y-27907]|uniref:Protein HID1 n=1 Tax=Spathaspora passalidarum (strain NRRL Y-27907 / 11-Y1) TaxID=619300 RepID=G3AEJ5_SPAPN|nr:uncharacterized protein SPAPADRAFT_130767 [Spathaspora passalidarum NRRL Y-27907]EGW34757.1 hypothetical protein SPAPADRAFT_130767 [Spathaspora passalidarum NRRL Y-27907]